MRPALVAALILWTCTASADDEPPDQNQIAFTHEVKWGWLVRQLYRTVDGGLTWRPVHELPQAIIRAIFVSPHDSDLVLVRIRNGELYRATPDEFHRTQDADDEWRYITVTHEPRRDAPGLGCVAKARAGALRVEVSCLSEPGLELLVTNSAFDLRWSPDTARLRITAPKRRTRALGSVEARGLASRVVATMRGLKQDGYGCATTLMWRCNSGKERSITFEEDDSKQVGLAVSLQPMLKLIGGLLDTR